MKWFPHSTRLQWYSFVLSMPLIGTGLLYVLFGERIFSELKIWLFAFPIIWLLGLGTWYMHIRYDYWATQRFPEIRQTRQRAFLKTGVVVLIMSPAVVLIFFLFDWLHILGYGWRPEHLKSGMLIGYSVNLIFLALWEAIYIMDKHKESLAEREILRQMSLQQEFDVLKSQVNPHFLFNCFNTLSSLIVEDPQRADSFLNELSKVYRYLLRSNESSLSTLENELRFIESYFRLLKTRHGEAVQFQTEIDKRYANYMLPSLSLQLLVENAVKHNVLSKNKPLSIDIFTTAANRLVVSNNLQRRTKKGPSNRIGLDNIRTKYELLRQRGFQVMEDEKSFTVVLPLIWAQGLTSDWKEGKNDKTKTHIPFIQ